MHVSGHHFRSHHSYHPPFLRSFIPGLILTIFHKSFQLQTAGVLISGLFIDFSSQSASFLVYFLFIPYGRLSWLLFSFWAQNTLKFSHHIVSYHISVSYHQNAAQFFVETTVYRCDPSSWLSIAAASQAIRTWCVVFFVPRSFSGGLLMSWTQNRPTHNMTSQTHLFGMWFFFQTSN